MIQSIIDKISKTSTVIIIAHRLATIQNVDKILKMENGKVSYVNWNKIQIVIYNKN